MFLYKETCDLQLKDSKWLALGFKMDETSEKFLIWEF